MNKFFRVVAFAVYVSGVGMLATSTAEAGQGRNGRSAMRSRGDSGSKKFCVPEVGAQGSAAALALALGGVAVMAGGRKRRVAA